MNVVLWIAAFSAVLALAGLVPAWDQRISILGLILLCFDVALVAMGVK